MTEKTPVKKITRLELYEKFPYLKNLSLKDMLHLVHLCITFNSDEDLIYYVECYMHSYPELARLENINKVFE